MLSNIFSFQTFFNGNTSTFTKNKLDSSSNGVDTCVSSLKYKLSLIPVSIERISGPNFHIKIHDELEINVDLGVGNQSATCYTCDFSHDYISINADYRS